MFRDSQSQKRTTESPMDWEWQTQGPTDPKSPFPQFKPQEGQKAGFESPRPTSSFMGASSTPAPQFRNPSFTTPRKPFDQELFSEVSGAETSPADNADAEDTPDLPKQIQTMTVSTGTVRQPLFQRYGAGFLGSSPGRAEQRRGKYANAIVNKVRKRKRIDRDYALARAPRDESESDSDDGDSRLRSRKGKPPKQEPQPGYLVSTFNYIESHPNLPNILSFYAQLGVNIFIAGLTIFVMYSFWMTVRADVDKASENERALLLTEMAACATEFVDNGCASDRRVPALKTVCENWEHCMKRDPDSIGRARVSAHTFAHIFNSFIEPISYKAMFFVVLIIVAFLLINNLAFGVIRSKAAHITQPQSYFPPPQQNFQWGPPPQTPHYEPQTPQRSVAYDNYNGQSCQAIMPSKGNRKSQQRGQKSK